MINRIHYLTKTEQKQKNGPESKFFSISTKKAKLLVAHINDNDYYHFTSSPMYMKLSSCAVYNVYTGHKYILLNKFILNLLVKLFALQRHK